MLRIGFYFTVVLISLRSTAQRSNLEDLKKADTIYIEFDQDNQNWQKKVLNLKQINTRYLYYFKGKPKSHFEFTFSDMLDFDQKADIQELSKELLNKKVVVQSNFFDQLSIREAWSYLKNKQAYYIIEKNNDQVDWHAKQVNFFSTYENTNDLDVKCFDNH